MRLFVKALATPTSSAAELFNAVLTSRGIGLAKAQNEFLDPPRPTLEYLLPQLSLSRSILHAFSHLLDKHLRKGYDILVFGDYDADGVTATSIMWQALITYRKLKGSSSRILPFIPDRQRHGYGLSSAAIDDLVSGVAFATSLYSDFVPKLIVTVDTGIVAVEGVRALRSRFGDVVITDHHMLVNTLPPANVIVHSLGTSGAGIAWVVALYLLGSSAYSLLDLAVIGVVADMMSVIGVNRALITHGLAALSCSRRPGIVALKTTMGISDKLLTTYDISFGLAPRINAAGRIYNSQDALRLLCTSNALTAQKLATKIESHNHDRKEYTDQALNLVKVTPSHNILILVGDYHEGVIGLVAGKLVEKYTRPAIVLANNGKVVKGSARSLPGINITALLRSLKTPFLGLGGHEQAAGFSLEAKHVKAFTAELTLLADITIEPKQLVKTEVVDLELTLSQVTLTLAELLNSLEPFGLGNPKPKILLRDLTVLEDKPLGVEGKHHKLTVEQNGTTREVLMFNTQFSHPLSFIKVLSCQLDINVWRDKRRLQLISSYVET